MSISTPATAGNTQTRRYWRADLTIYSSMDRGVGSSVEFHLDPASSTFQIANADEAVAKLNSQPATNTQSDLLEAAKEAQRLLADLARPVGSVERVSAATGWARCIETEARLRTAIRNAEQGGGG